MVTPGADESLSRDPGPRSDHDRPGRGLKMRIFNIMARRAEGRPPRNNRIIRKRDFCYRIDGHGRRNSRILANFKVRRIPDSGTPIDKRLWCDLRAEEREQKKPPAVRGGRGPSREQEAK
jgi:hypothetical protein